MKYFIIFSLTLFIQLDVIAQAGSNFVQYSKDFRFQEGVYVNFMDWKNNKPVNLDRIITNYNRGEKRFFFDLLSEKRIKYYDQNGKIQEVKSAEVFGYSIDGLVFTHEHVEINIIGAICHFSNIMMNTVVEQHVSYLIFGKKKGQDQIKEFIIDFEGNRKLFFKKKNIEEILKRDSQLYKEYKKAKGKEKYKLYQFIFKYNEKHPIYFPKYD